MGNIYIFGTNLWHLKSWRKKPRAQPYLTFIRYIALNTELFLFGPWFNFAFCLLSVSCPSANEFSAILFLLFARSNPKSPRPFQRFRRTLRQYFNWIRQQMKKIPKDPHCKNCPLSATLSRCRKRAILTMGYMWEFFTRCQIWMKLALEFV